MHEKAARCPGPPAQEPAPAIAVVDCGLRAGRSQLLDGLTFTVPRGSICGLLAPSGGGKTTTQRLLAGIYPPTRGTVEVLGSAPSRWRREERRRLGYMPQHFVLYPELTVEQNLRFMAGLYGLTRAERDRRIEALLATIELRDARHRAARRLSGGMQRRLQLAATLLHDPELLIIDEPTAGIDPLLRARFWEHFRHLRAAGRTLIVATQYVAEAEYCDRVVMLRAGRTVAAGTPEELRSTASAYAAVHGLGPVATFEDVFRVLMERAMRAAGS